MRVPWSSSWRFALIGALMATFGGATQAHAASPSPDDGGTSDDAAQKPGDGEREVAAAGGDLSPVEAEASATPPTFQRLADEAATAEREGRYVAALETWQGMVSMEPALTESQRATVEAAVARLTDLARGRGADDPASTQREVLDFRRSGAARPSPLPLNTEASIPERAAEGTSEPVVRQWYFWVAVSLIAAAVGTITGLAIQSATNPGGVDGRAAAASPSAAGSRAVVRF